MSTSLKTLIGKLNPTCRRAAERAASLCLSRGNYEVDLERCTEVDSGARNVDHILNGSLLPEIAQSVRVRMADGGSLSKIKVSANAAGEFKYRTG